LAGSVVRRFFFGGGGASRFQLAVAAEGSNTMCVLEHGPDSYHGRQSKKEN